MKTQQTQTKQKEKYNTTTQTNNIKTQKNENIT